jgi:hypothetical protein
MPDNVNITVNETIENIVINPSISTDVIDVNTYSTTENVTIDVTPNLTTVNINTITGSLITKTSDLINDGEDGVNPFITLEDIPVSGLTSVGLTMPVAFNVANSPLTSDGTIAVSAAGTSSQYIRGDGQLATLPSGGGGGSSVNYYLNGSIPSGVVGYQQMDNDAIIGAGTDFTLTGNGLISQFLTDLGNPNRTEIPGGAWNFEMFFSMSSNGGTPAFYVELLKYNGTTFTSIASSSAVPENITGGTSIDLYLTSLAVPTTPLLITDRLAIRVYIVNNSGGRTATLHTENSHLCEIITTFSGGVTSLNGLTANTQYLAVGTTGTDFNINSLVDTHTFNLPTASATNRGALSTTDWSAFNSKFTLPSLTSGSVLFSDGTTIAQKNSNFFWDNTNNRLGVGTASPTTTLDVNGTTRITTPTILLQNNGNIALNINDSSNSAVPVINLQQGGSSKVTFEAGVGLANRLDIKLGGSRAVTMGAGGVFGVSIGRTYSGTIPPTDGLIIQGNTLINTTTDNGGKLQIKAPGALSTDIALRVRNSADTADLFNVLGDGSFGKLTSGSDGTFYFSGGAGLTAAAVFQQGASNFNGFRIQKNAQTLIDEAGVNAFVTTSAILELKATTKGFLPPRMTSTQKNAIATPASGLVVYDTTLGKLCVRGAASWETITSV